MRRFTTSLLLVLCIPYTSMGSICSQLFVDSSGIYEFKTKDGKLERVDLHPNLRHDAETKVGQFFNKNGARIDINQTKKTTIKTVLELTDIFLESLTYMYPYQKVVPLEEAKNFVDQNGRDPKLADTIEYYTQKYIDLATARGKNPTRGS